MNISNYSHEDKAVLFDNCEQTEIIENYIDDYSSIANAKKCIFSKDFLIHIFSFLEPIHIVECRISCKLFKQLIDESKTGVIFKDYAFMAKKKSQEFYSKISLLEKQIDTLKSKNLDVSKLESQKKTVSENYYFFRIVGYQNIKREEDTESFIMALFGGKKKYEKLPVLDDICKYSVKSIVNSIKNRDVDSICRAEDLGGRKLFAIKTRNLYANGKLDNCYHTHCFFEESIWGNKCWLKKGITFNISDKIIENGCIHCQESYDTLKELIQTGKCKQIPPIKGCPEQYLILAGSPLDKEDPIDPGAEMPYFY